MKLIDLLVKELPKRGGWPECALNATQDKDGEVCFSAGAVPEFGYAAWEGGNWCGNEFHTIMARDYATSIVTRRQYESALAASDGWIEWGGGYCPVKYGTMVDIRDGDGYEWYGVKATQSREYSDACSTFWEHKGSPENNIIAYRLHKPEINSRAKDDRLEQDLNECIGQGVAPESEDKFPETGLEVEYSTYGQSAWYRVIVTACGESMCIVKNLSGAEQAFHKFDIEFRPLRTEAEKSKSMAIGAMERSWDEVMNKPSQSFEIIYEAIAAGKIPGIKLEAK